MPTTKQTVKTEISDPDNAPGVIAYRVGQLEKTVIQGFKEHNDKLDSLANNFVSVADFQSLHGVVDQNSKDITVLKAADQRQIGSIDTTRRIVAIGLTLFGIFVSAVAIYLGGHHG